MLRGLGYVLHQPRSTSESWLPLARQLLIDHGEWQVEDEAKIEQYRAIRQKRREEENEEEEKMRLKMMKK
jgi:hypothetical protein